MSTISSVLNSTNYYTQNTITTSGNTQIHHHKVKEVQTSTDTSGNTTTNIINSTDETSTEKKNPLDSLVNYGTITLAQEEAINATFKAAVQANAAGTYSKNQVNPLSSLVEAGTITQSQADAIKSTLKPPALPQKDNQSSPIDDKLSSLVSAGTITQKQADAIKNALKPPAEVSETDDDTAESNSDKTDPLASLVSAGTITQSQADEIREALQAALVQNEKSA